MHRTGLNRHSRTCNSGCLWEKDLVARGKMEGKHSGVYRVVPFKFCALWIQYTALWILPWKAKILKKKKKWKPPSRSSSLLLWASVTVFRLGPVFILTFPASTDWLQSLLGGHGWVTFVFPRVVRTSFGAERKVTIGLFTVYWCQEFTFGRQVDLQSGSMIRTGNSASLSIKITQISWKDFQQT